MRLCEPFLEIDEGIQGIFSGLRSQALRQLRVVAITDRCLLVVETEPEWLTWQPLRAQSAKRLPRATRIGPRYGLGWYLVDGRRLLTLSRRDQRVIAEADAAMGFPPPS